MQRVAVKATCAQGAFATCAEGRPSDGRYLPAIAGFYWVPTQWKPADGIPSAHMNQWIKAARKRNGRETERKGVDKDEK
ncbi:MAG TPA: hypothetical protein GX505_14305 [Clostridiales bacterium]|nr:hypothetical protein [Clostridiales bacterium]